MTIKAKIFYIVKCDKCGKEFPNIFDEYFYKVKDNEAVLDTQCTVFIFETKKEAIEAINSKGWKIKGEKIYCDVCKNEVEKLFKKEA